MTIEEITGEVYVFSMGSIKRAHGLKLFGLFDGRDLVRVLSRRLGKSAFRSNCGSSNRTGFLIEQKNPKRDFATDFVN